MEFSPVFRKVYSTPATWHWRKIRHVLLESMVIKNFGDIEISPPRDVQF
jgi:hypothetical protein